jgi:hypothetical protein
MATVEVGHRQGSRGGHGAQDGAQLVTALSTEEPRAGLAATDRLPQLADCPASAVKIECPIGLPRMSRRLGQSSLVVLE